MAKEVIKKDGTKAPFEVEKIKKSITAAARNTDLTAERTDEVAERVTAAVLQAAEGKDEIATSEIKEKILNELDSLEPSVSAAWREYDKEKKGS